MPNNETLADIVAKIRLFAKNITHRPFSWEMVSALAKLIADRIEAAAQRDQAQGPSSSTKRGDAAAMRAALESMSENLAMHVRCGRFVAPGDHVSFPISEAEAYIRDIRAALAAPPRNCDRYRTEKEAEAAFDRFCMKTRTGECKPWECPLRSTGGKYCFVAWLLGTEGGAE